jgi:hypothetical protein
VWLRLTAEIGEIAERVIEISASSAVNDKSASQSEKPAKKPYEDPKGLKDL